MILNYSEHSGLCLFLLKLSGDIEENSGPERKSCQSLSICYWNVNSITTHMFVKILLLWAYLFIKFNAICISKTFLESSKVLSDQNLKVEWYNLVTLDHPSKSKLGGVYICFKQMLALNLSNAKSLQ